MDIYRMRSQIVFLLRDSKQFIWLTHCLSRQKEALSFRLNMSLSTINVAMAFAHQDKRSLSVNINDLKELLYYVLWRR